MTHFQIGLRSRWAKAAVLAALFGVAAWQFVPDAAAHRSPPGCNTNVLVFALSRPSQIYQDGDTIHYSVTMQVPPKVGNSHPCDISGISSFFTPPGGGAPVALPVVALLEPNDSVTFTGTDEPTLDYVINHAHEDVNDAVMAAASATGTAHTGDNDDTASANNNITTDIIHPDLHLVKDAKTSPISAGPNGVDEACFTITVTNEGEGSAKNVDMTDTLPGTGWFINNNSAGWNCNITAGANDLLECTAAEFTGNQTGGKQTDHVQVCRETTPADCGTLENSASVTSDNIEDPDQFSNSDGASITVNCPDVHVDKSAVDGEISAGEQACFTIVASNAGPGDAFVVEIDDTLPGSGWSITAQDATACNITGGNLLHCDVGTLAPLGTYSVTVCRDTTAEDCGELDNTATVSAANEPTADQQDNEDSASITVDCPDVHVDKSAVDGEISAGEKACFTIVASNAGPGDAFDVAIDDTLPGSGWSIDSQDGSACNITGGNILHCDVGTLAPQGTYSVTVCRDTTAEDCGTLENTAKVSASNESEQDAQDNEDSANITVNCPDVHVDKSAVDGEISAGEQACFTIVASNAGPGDAFDVAIDDTLPGSGWSIDSQDGSACNITGGNILHCDVGTLAPQATYSVTVCRDTTAEDCGELNNTATVSASNEPTADQQDNEDSASITVLCPDVHVDKSAGESPINASEKACFTVVASNAGPGDAFDVAIDDTLPGSGWSIDSQDGSACNITGGNILHCDVGTLAPQATYSVTVCRDTTAEDCGELNNTATVSASNEPTADQQDNEDSASITVNCPDVHVDKTADESPVDAGDQACFTIMASNDGVGTAFDVELHDTLPGTGWSIDSQDGSACNITPGANDQLDCSIGTLTSGGTYTVKVCRKTTPEDCGDLENTATVSASNEPTADQSDNEDSATITVDCPDVHVAKDAVESPISAGEKACFSITVSNDGAGKATGVKLTDTLPGTGWSIDSQDGSACNITTGANDSLDCDIGDLASGATYKVTVCRTTTPEDCGDLENTATVSADNEPQADQSDDSDSATITVNCPDVHVDKTADNSPVNAGEDACFTMVVSNAGPGDAFDVTLDDTLPGSGWNISAQDGSACNITGGNLLHCDIGNLTSGATYSVTVCKTTAPEDCGQLDNTATVAASNESEADAQDNEDSASINVQCPDVHIKKDANATPIDGGDTASFTITVTNDGAGTATNVDMTDTLPGTGWGITFADAGWTCNITPAANDLLECTTASLASGGSLQVTVERETDPDTDCGEMFNEAHVSAINEPAGNQVDNTDDATIVVNCADVHVDKTADDTPINAGDKACFTIKVSNDGAGTAHDVKLTDTLPGTGWSIDSQDGSACNITPGSDDSLECDIGDLASGGTYTLMVCKTTTAEDCGELPNTATVEASNEPTEDQSDNSDSATIIVNCPDVHVDKTADKAPITAGDQACFSMVVSNAGPGTAYDVALDDTLPGSGWSIDSQDGSACNITGGNLLHCDIGTLAPQATYTVKVCRDTTSADCGNLENTASVSASNESEADAQDNTDDATIVVECPDVHVDKTAAHTPINAGGQACFTMVVSNDGDGTATGVMLNDTLPGTGWAIDSQTAAACNISGGNALSCNIGTLASGATYSVTVCKTTTAANCGTLENTATVSATNEPQADQNDNTDSASIVVNCPDVHVDKNPVTTPITAPANACFSMTVSNDGAGTATGVILTDTLPGTGWSISSQDASACNISGGNILTCSIGTMASGATYHVTVCRPTSSPTDCGDIVNTAHVTATNESALDAQDNSDSATVHVNCPGGGQGCTPGFWCGGVGKYIWNTSPDPEWTAVGGAGNPPFIQTRLFNTFFTPHAFLNGKTMADIVCTGGGPNPVRKAARDLIAAYLNSSFGLAYPFTPSQLSAMWTAAVTNGSSAAFMSLHNTLDAANNLGCNIGWNGNKPKNGQVGREGQPTGTRPPQ